MRVNSGRSIDSGPESACPPHPAAWLGLLGGGALLTVLLVLLVSHLVHGALLGIAGGHHRLRVMTWNVGKIYFAGDSRAADEDLDHFAQVVREVDPQIVALQELKDSIQLGRLLAALGPSWRGRLPDDAYDRRAALLTRLPARFIELTTSTGRTAQGAEITLPGGATATVISVHLDAFDTERRTRQAEEILASANRLGNQELFIAGDFNFDAAAVARDSPEYRLYLTLTSDMVDAGRYAGGTTLTAQRLDYVFYRSQLVNAIKARVLGDRRINTMDHDPLVVELTMDLPAVPGARQEAR